MQLHVNAVSLSKKPSTTCLILIFWHMAPCSLADRYQRFRRTYRRNISPGTYTQDGNRRRDYYASAHSKKILVGFINGARPQYISMNTVHDFQVTSPLCSIVIEISKYKIYSLTQRSIRQLLKYIFNHTSQLHVSARPSGAIFRLNFHKK
jgi:hypothetical protein